MTTRPERRWPLWPWLVLTIAGVGITAVAAIVGAVVDSDSGAAESPPVPPTVTVTAVQIQPSTVTRTVTATSPPGPVSEFDDGVFEVGVDVVPGTFRTDGPDGTNVTGCYWSRIAPSGDVIANGVLNRPGTVTMTDGDRFDTAGCQPWYLET